jgi:hypothetical protein
LKQRDLLSAQGSRRGNRPGIEMSEPMIVVGKKRLERIELQQE